MLLLDTNICILLMKNRLPAAAERLWRCDPAATAISSATLFELEYGAAKSQWPERNRNSVRLFLAPLTILPFEARDAAAAGEIRRYLERAGTLIGPYDLLIAAQGLARGCTVVTHNADEFSRVPGLRVEDWARGQ